MAYFRKKLERRTFSQDRYYILIKRQKEGKATFGELTELDEIVNRVPDIREKVILENFATNNPANTDNPPGGDTSYNPQRSHQNFWWKVRSALSRVFASHMHVTTQKYSVLY
jgi:hypothetical protein